MKLSIIIPMYNCERYIADCLDSILNSDLPKGEYEVIIVNDGSKDKGPEIAQDYVSKHDNFRYLTQENQGQSVARNYGLKEAKGEYVWFVDGDDKVERFLCKFIDILHIYKLDSLVTTMVVTDEQGEKKGDVKEFNIPYNIVIYGRDVFFSDVPIGSVCGIFLSKSFLVEHALFFVPGITQQDVELSNRIFAYAKRVMFIKEISYIYIKHLESTSMSQNPQRRKKYILNTIDIILSLQNLSRDLAPIDSQLAERIEEKSQNQVLGLLINVFRNRRKWKRLGITEDVINKLKENKLYPMSYRYKSKKKLIVAHILNFNLLLRLL